MGLVTHEKVIERSSRIFPISTAIFEGREEVNSALCESSQVVKMVEPTSPPSFVTLFNEQPKQKRQSSWSFDNYADFHPLHQSFPDATRTDAFVAEPQSFDDPDYNQKNGRCRDVSSDTAVGHNAADQKYLLDPSRKESFPFNPQEDPTIIATAPRNGTQSISSPPIREIMFRSQQSISNPQQLQQQDWWPEDGHAAQYRPQQDINAFQTPSPSNYTDCGAVEANKQQGGWGQEFLGAGQQDVHENGIKMNVVNNDTVFDNGLQRIISNTSHPSQQTSPVPSPSYPEQTPQSARESFHRHSRTGSFSNSPSPNSFAAHPSQMGIPNSSESPPTAGQYGFQTSSSPLTNPNPHMFGKPQSPPALIIPGNSPAFPSIVSGQAHTNQAYAQNAANHPHQSPPNNDVGGLFPPANPALERLTGMAGISPIAPSVDGPKICIQPSTPISGPNENKGLFGTILRPVGFIAAQRMKNFQEQSNRQKQGSQQAFNVPPPQSHPLPRASSPNQPMETEQGDTSAQGMDFNTTMEAFPKQEWTDIGDSLRVAASTRPRSKSDSIIPSPTADSFNRDAFWNFVSSNPSQVQGNSNQKVGQSQPELGVEGEDQSSEQWRDAVDVWKANLAGDENAVGQPGPTLDPRLLPGRDAGEVVYQQLLAQQQPGELPRLDAHQLHQLNQMEAQRARIASSNNNNGMFRHTSGESPFAPFGMYQLSGFYSDAVSERSGTVSAPWSQTTFGDIPISDVGVHPATSGPSQHTFLIPEPSVLPRRRSFGGEHPAMGAGTPGYGMEFASTLGSKPSGQLRTVGTGHRRTPRSVDLGRIGGETGWGMGSGSSTAEFLQSITSDDGSLLPPSARGRTMSHSRNSSVSTVRSPSPALSISSQGSSFSHHSPRMDMPEGAQLPSHPTILQGQPPHTPQFYEDSSRKRVTKAKVTSKATGEASESRRKYRPEFRCPVPGCGSTFTRHFNLKGHLRSHNDERPFKCEYEGCPKAIVGFARQHDCKRHMLLHEGLRLFVCEGCGKKFARLDALTRHHKSEQGQECAIYHPLPTNPDGTPMSESQYKIFKGIKMNAEGDRRTSAGKGSQLRRKSAIKVESLSNDESTSNMQ
ncbi:hypothetical protein L204_103942 [Cryptococcus depauperatus]